MNTNHTASRKFFRIAAAALILGGVLSTGGAFANGLESVSETVKFADLNTDSPAGIAALYSRIHAAALRVCGSGSRDLSRLAAEERCAIDAEAHAVRQLNMSGLTAYYQAKSGRAVPTLAANAH